MSIVEEHDARTRFDELLRRVEQGEEIVIARAGPPVARLRPYGPTVRRFGFLDLGELPDDAFDPLTEQELVDWEKPL